MWRLSIILLATTACLKPRLVECGDGRACPVGTICDDTHATCVTQEQVDACTGVISGAACTAGALTGACSDGICFDIVCANRIVQPGEECDDGNFVDGDGCSASCLSERCGNGRNDAVFGEECDDGNSRAGDGCDSTCVAEQMTRTLRQCGEPRYLLQQYAAFDAQRGVIVYAQAGFVMEWDGAAWHCFESAPEDMGVAVNLLGLVYDAGRQRVVGIPSSRSWVYEWDGASWSARATNIITPNLQRLSYDTTVMRVVGYVQGGQDVWYLDTASGTWSSVTAVGATPPFNYLFSIGFDSANDRLVLLKEDATASQTTWLWDRTSRQWVNTNQTFPIDSQSVMTYDAVRQRVVAFGGYTSTYSAALYEWTGSTWSLRSTAPAARGQAAVMFDPGSGSLLVAGGIDSQGYYGDVWRLDGTGWTRWQQPGLIPRTTIGAVGFPPGGTTVAVTSTGETWIWDGTSWSQHASAPIPIGNLAKLAYDARHLRIVASDPSGWFGEFDGQSWQMVAMDAAPLTLRTMVVDPHLDRVLAIASDGRTYQRSASGWTQLATTPIWGVLEGSYDLRARRAVVIATPGAGSQRAYELAADDSSWLSVFDFGDSGYFHMAESYPRGSVLWVDAHQGATWERNVDLWKRGHVEPVSYGFSHAAADPRRGETLWISATGGQVFGYGYVSAAPHESCTDGVDGDGDGWIRCDDDDCWWSCHPDCPPLATCTY